MIIADIGINHNGSLENALELIKACKDIGVDVVKFQKRDLDTCFTKQQLMEVKVTPFGKMPYGAYKYMIELSLEQYKAIDNYCKEINMPWTASVWDIPSLEFIMRFDVPFIKIPSALNTNLELLKAVKRTHKPVVISSGMSELTEFKTAFYYIYPYWTIGQNITILACTSIYPCPEDKCNINYINTLKTEFPHYNIGYSGHEKGIGPTLLAHALGARVIERHITLDKNMVGSDQSSSLDINEFSLLITELKQIDKILGTGTKQLDDEELKVRKKLRYFDKKS